MEDGTGISEREVPGSVHPEGNVRVQLREHADGKGGAADEHPAGAQGGPAPLPERDWEMAPAPQPTPFSRCCIILFEGGRAGVSASSTVKLLVLLTLSVAEVEEQLFRTLVGFKTAIENTSPGRSTDKYSHTA